MKAIKVSELKNHLSRFLRRAQAGEQLVVMDRSRPVAQIGPPAPGGTTEREKMAAEGVLVLGGQRFSMLRFARTKKRIDAQALLEGVRED
jgi:prevent-host-death family protein